ncbi:MAG: hypothetical protein QS98_C0003G0023 [archaeon GW2011_AR3]|nr:MAG: hypothetical protein QS98_C0003G0023 [archaeon GW2011_AR3]
MGTKRGNSKVNYIFLYTILFAGLLFFLNSSERANAQCTACNGVEVCGGFNRCCTDIFSDSICPEDFGDWAAANCAFGCQTEDMDCCTGLGMQWTAATGWPGKKLRQPYTIAPVLPVTINYCCGNDA